MSGRRVRYGAWFLRVITWDAALPAIVASIPAVVRLAFPEQRGALEVTAVVLPVAAFLLRIGAGRRHIASNHCPVQVRRFQLAVFCLGILPLTLFDCAIMLSEIMPDGALFEDAGDRKVWLIMLAFYLSCMIMAMYPGAAEQPAEWPSHPSA